MKKGTLLLRVLEIIHDDDPKKMFDSLFDVFFSLMDQAHGHEALKTLFLESVMQGFLKLTVTNLKIKKKNKEN